MVNETKEGIIFSTSPESSSGSGSSSSVYVSGSPHSVADEPSSELGSDGEIPSATSLEMRSELNRREKLQRDTEGTTTDHASTSGVVDQKHYSQENGDDGTPSVSGFKSMSDPETDDDDETGKKKRKRDQMEGCEDYGKRAKKKKKTRIRFSKRLNEEESLELSLAGKKRKRGDVDERDEKKSKGANESIPGSEFDMGKTGIGKSGGTHRQPLNDEEREKLVAGNKRKQEDENEGESGGKKLKGNNDQTMYPVCEEKLGRSGENKTSEDEKGKRDRSEFVRCGTTSIRKEEKKRKRDELAWEYEQQLKTSCSSSIDEKQGKLSGKKRKTPDDMDPVAMTMMISSDGYDDESVLVRTIIVRNLGPGKVKKTDLIAEFGEFGEIESVRIQSVPTEASSSDTSSEGHHHDHHAYIVFKTENSAAEAWLSHKMAMMHKTGNEMQVVRACPPQKKSKGQCDND